jgi:hypothetical protein
MKINKFLTLLIVFVLLFSTVGTAFADDDPEGDPLDPVTTTDDTTDPDWVHPIVALLAAYMEYQQGTTEPEPTGDPLPEPTDPPDPTADPTTEPLTFEDEIAALHADGMGFGVLVKLLTLSDKGDASLATLADEFKAGHGFKQLYEDYGHPTAHGVGHIKQEMKCVEAGGVDCTNNHAKGKNKEGKPGKGNNKP